MDRLARPPVSTHSALRDAFQSVIGASVRPTANSSVLPRDALRGSRSASQIAYSGESRGGRWEPTDDGYMPHSNTSLLSTPLFGLPGPAITPRQDPSFPSLHFPSRSTPPTPASSVPITTSSPSSSIDKRLKRTCIVLTPTRHPLGALFPRARRQFRLYGDILGGMSLLTRALRRYERLQVRLDQAGVTYDELVSAGKWISREEVQESLVMIMGDLVAAMSPIAYKYPRRPSGDSQAGKYLRSWNPAILAAHGTTDIPADWTPTTLALCAATEIFDRFFVPFSLPSSPSPSSSPPLPPIQATTIVLQLLTRAVSDSETLLRVCDRVANLYAGELAGGQEQDLLDLRKALATAYAASGRLERGEEVLRAASADAMPTSSQASPTSEEMRAIISLHTTRINLAAAARDMERATAALLAYRELLASASLPPHQQLPLTAGKAEGPAIDAPYLALMRASAAQLNAASFIASDDTSSDDSEPIYNGIGSAGRIKRLAVSHLVQQMRQDGVSASLATLEFLIPFYASGRCWEQLGDALVELHVSFSGGGNEAGQMELSTYRACFRAQYQLICARSAEGDGSQEASLHGLFARLATAQSPSSAVGHEAGTQDGALYLLAPTSLWRTGLAALLASLSPSPLLTRTATSASRSPARHTASLSNQTVAALNEALRTLLAIHDLCGAREVLSAFDDARVAPDAKTCRIVLLACARRENRTSTAAAAAVWADSDEQGAMAAVGYDAYERIMGKGGLGEVLERRLEQGDGERSTPQTLVDLLDAAHV